MYTVRKTMAVKGGTFFEVGEIRPARDSDFQHFIDLADGGGWTKKLEKNGLLAWSRNMENASIKMFKVRMYVRLWNFSFCMREMILHTTESN